jgi:hypothetical protein
LIEPSLGADRLRRGGRALRRVVWLILPVVLGGIGHVVVLRTDVLRSLAIPLDGGARLRGRPVFGANKTWRGVVVMTGSTALVGGVQAALGRRLHWQFAVELQRSASVKPWLAGAICGAAYVVAELPNSFIKRRLGIAPGARAVRRGRLQYIVDQADSVAGCLIPLRLLYGSSRAELLTAFGLGLAIHVAIDAARA